MTPTFAEASHPEFRMEQEEAREAQQALEDQLGEIALKIDGYRLAMRPPPSDRAWVKMWPGLGSAKTWGKILKGDFSELNAATRLPNYRGVLSALSAGVSLKGREELYEDQPGTQAVILAALRLMHHYGKDRLLLIKGGTGSGKTSALDVLERSEGSGAMVRCEADDTWKSEKVAMYDILVAMGESEDAVRAITTTGDRLKKILAIAKRRGRITLVVDEAHHCTGRVLNLFKTLLNRTEMLLILAGMSTLLQKLRAAASEEARQLFLNRMFCSVNLAGPDAQWVGEFLRRRLGVEGKWRVSTLTTLATEAQHNGTWSYLRRIQEHLQDSRISDPDDSDLMSASQTASAEIA